ncbi:hypothetical protein EVAR_14319_1 [Eumeta japonica]|uniref:Uncharacterized protein n=1 Tax=Eumeta variegata TaxID=151549 RepID=A0A4C1UM38_EUMVA|nr:hypothetical protein EVAR_14319_1 [Eumeta japonica]
MTDDLREGHSSTATAQDNSTVRIMIETTKIMTYQQIHQHTTRKLCTRWIPHNLTEDPRLRTGDESWIHCYDPETKSQFAQWLLVFEELSIQIMRYGRVEKSMVAYFFGKTGFTRYLVTNHTMPDLPERRSRAPACRVTSREVRDRPPIECSQPISVHFVPATLRLTRPQTKARYLHS